MIPIKGNHPKDRIGTTEAGKLIGRSAGSIRLDAISGDLPHEIVAGRRVYHRADVEQWGRDRTARAIKQSEQVAGA